MLFGFRKEQEIDQIEENSVIIDRQDGNPTIILYRTPNNEFQARITSHKADSLVKVSEIYKVEGCTEDPETAPAFF